MTLTQALIALREACRLRIRLAYWREKRAKAKAASRQGPPPPLALAGLLALALGLAAGCASHDAWLIRQNEGWLHLVKTNDPSQTTSGTNAVPR
jgi:hypothetical protein